MVISVESTGNHAETPGGTTPPNPPGERGETVYLDKLAEELTHRGMEAWLMTPPGRMPSVYVTNPAARALEDNVYAVRGQDGMMWFWWSWAERISIADDLDLAASTIARVLSLPRG